MNPDIGSTNSELSRSTDRKGVWNRRRLLKASLLAAVQVYPARVLSRRPWHNELRDLQVRTNGHAWQLLEQGVDGVKKQLASMALTGPLRICNASGITWPFAMPTNRDLISPQVSFKSGPVMSPSRPQTTANCSNVRISTSSIFRPPIIGTPKSRSKPCWLVRMSIARANDAHHRRRDFDDEICKKTGRVVQIGTQQRSDPSFLTAIALIRAGRIGKLIRATCGIGGRTD